jgi:hypothetical protein
LSGDKSVTEEGPEKGSDGTCMEGSEDNEDGRTLLEKRAGGEKLEREGEEVDGEESPNLDAT